MATPSASWYTDGSAGIEKAIEQREDRALGLNAPRRAFIPQDPSVTKNYLVVDDVGASIMEHRFCINGNWKNWATCSGDDCYACSVGHRPSMMQMLTTVSLTPYTATNGTTYNYECEIYAVNGDSWKRLSRFKAANQGLAGKAITAARLGEKAPSCGDDFSMFKANPDLDKLFGAVQLNNKKLSDLYKQAAASPDFLAKLKNVIAVEVGADGKTPLLKIPKLNYYQIFQPLPLADMKRLVASADLKISKKDAAAAASTSKPEDTDIPF